MPSRRPLQQVPVDLARVGPAAGEPDQRLGLVKRPARGDVVGQLVLAVGGRVGAALVEGVAERQVQARPGSRVGRVLRDPCPGPRLGGLAARPLGAGGGEEGAGRLGGGQVTVGAEGVPRDADGEAGVGVVLVADALGQREERAPVQRAAQRGIGVQPGDHVVAMAAVREADARRGVDPRQAARVPLLAVGVRVGQVQHPGDQCGVDDQVIGGDRGGRQPGGRDLGARGGRGGRGGHLVADPYRLAAGRLRDQP